MNRSFTSTMCGTVLVGALFCGGSLQARQNSSSKPDNTAANKQDRQEAAPTADQAKNKPTDRELMRDIRRDVVKDKALSTYGHNVKIVAEHGKVTLKGPVHSDDEKKAIEDYARKYAGDGNVDDQITVKSDQK